MKIVEGVPRGWKLRTLGDVADTNLSSYTAKGLPDEINYVDISSVARGEISVKKPMASSNAPGRARRKVKDGDVVWSNVRPNLRGYALVLDPDEEDVFSTGFTVLSAERVPFMWLYMTVTSNEFVGHLTNHATGVGYPAVRPSDFKQAMIVLPPRKLLDLFQEATEPNFRMISILQRQNHKLAHARDLLLPRLMDGRIVA